VLKCIHIYINKVKI